MPHNSPAAILNFAHTLSNFEIRRDVIAYFKRMQYVSIKRMGSIIWNRGKTREFRVIPAVNLERVTSCLISELDRV